MLHNVIGLPSGLPDEKRPAGDLRESIACGLIACDNTGKVSLCSPDAAALLHSQVSSRANRAAIDLPAGLQKIIGEIIKGRKATITRQVKLPGPGKRSIRVRAFPLAARKGTKPGAVLLLDDVAAARRLQQNIARLDRLANIGTLSTSLAHEIKNGLVAIKTFVDLLLEQNRDAELAEVVSRELKRIEGLANQMLHAANPAKVDRSPVPIHELLDHSLRLVKRQLDDKLIVLRRSFQATPDIIQGSGHQLEQAFMNLLLNAVEAMGPNGELTVATENLAARDGQPARLHLTFRDTGIGIPPENLPRMFETFFTTKKNGTGLGLAITRRIVHEHAGEIFVESKPNQGATFRLSLPLA